MTTQKGYTANYLCLSTDVKPLDKDINSIMHELDTDKYYYFDGSDWNEIPNSGGGGGGFTPTTEQLAAMNSGITAEDVTQIGTNENNISSLNQNKIGASDYASQSTGGTVRVWTTTSGGETTLHIANEAPTP